MVSPSQVLSAAPCSSHFSPHQHGSFRTNPLLHEPLSTGSHSYQEDLLHHRLSRHFSSGNIHVLWYRALHGLPCEYQVNTCSTTVSPCIRGTSAPAPAAPPVPLTGVLPELVPRGFFPSLLTVWAGFCPFLNKELTGTVCLAWARLASPHKGVPSAALPPNLYHGHPLQSPLILRGCCFKL